MSQTIFVIPARMASTRLPQKPLASINNEPMIVHTWRRVKEACPDDRVIVACCGPEISQVIRNLGGEAVETDPDLPSGTDRVHAAVEAIDPIGEYKVVVNVQGDLPFIKADALSAVLKPLNNPNVDMATVAASIQDPQEIHTPQVVKIAMSAPDEGLARAFYFSRSAIPANATTHYHHIGLYAFRREALRRFVALPPSYLEQTEKLEQLRALENGMRIDVALTHDIPLSVDTLEDLIKVRKSSET